jgi:hypothetical protein
LEKATGFQQFEEVVQNRFHVVVYDAAIECADVYDIEDADVLRWNLGESVPDMESHVGG